MRRQGRTASGPVLVVAALLALIVVPRLVSFYVDWLWFESVDLSRVFLTSLKAEAFWSLAGGLLGFLVVYASHRAMVRATRGRVALPARAPGAEGGMRIGRNWAVLLFVLGLLAILDPAGARAQSPPTLAEVLDQPSWTFTTGGSASWFGQTAVALDNEDAAQSGDIEDGQSAFLETARTTGDQFIAFVWRVSSEEDFDFLRFYIDDVEQAAISGEVGWRQMVFRVAAADHVFRWVYSKDECASDGSDAGWVDQVTVTDMPPPVSLAVDSDPDHGVSIQVSPADRNQAADGLTPFERMFDYNTLVTLTAPLVSGSWEFASWDGCGATDGTSCTVSMTNSRSVRANYRLSLAEALDQPSWTFTSSGGWSGVSDRDWDNHDGTDAARGWAAGNAVATLDAVAPDLGGSGYLSFWWRCYGGSLELFVGEASEPSATCSGWEWQKIVVPVGAGAQTLHWIASGAQSGYVQAFLDQVALSTAASVTVMISGRGAGGGVPISVSEPDQNGNKNGTTYFEREYPVGTNVELTAPLAQGIYTFSGWDGCDSSPEGHPEVCSLSLQEGVYSLSIEARHEVTLAEALDQPSWTFTSTSSTWGGSALSSHDGADAAFVSVEKNSVATLDVVAPDLGGSGYLSFWWRCVTYGDGRLGFYVGEASEPSATCSGPSPDWQKIVVPVGAGAQTLHWIASGAQYNSHAYLDQVALSTTAPSATVMVNAIPTTTPSARFIVSGWDDGGVPISVSVPDQNGNKDGSTYFEREYPVGTNVELTAPLAQGIYIFSGWDGCDSSPEGHPEVCSLSLREGVYSLSVWAKYEVPLAEALDQPSWAFTSPPSSGGWSGVDWLSHDGTDAALGWADGSGVATLDVVAPDLGGSGYLSFWWKCISFFGGSLEFYVGEASEPSATCSEGGWQKIVVPVGAGRQTLHWIASGQQSGTVSAYLDQVALAPDPATSHAPVLDAVGNKSVAEGTLLSFSLSASDEDGDGLTYRATGLPRGAALTSGGAFSWMPGYTQAGACQVTFTVSDGSLTDEETITISVTAPTGPTFQDDFADGAATSDWGKVSGTWLASGGLYAATSPTRNNLARVRPLDPDEPDGLPLAAGVIQAKVKITSTASRSGPNGMLIFGYQDAAHYRWVKITPTKIIIGQTGAIGPVAGGIKKTVPKGQALGKWAVYTVKIYANGWVNVYKGTKAVAAYRFTAGGAGNVVPGGVGLGALRAKTVFDNVKVWDDTARATFRPLAPGTRH